MHDASQRKSIEHFLHELLVPTSQELDLTQVGTGIEIGKKKRRLELGTNQRFNWQLVIEFWFRLLNG
jgi:hypothetical protein